MCVHKKWRQEDGESLTGFSAFPATTKSHTGAQDFGIIGKVYWERRGGEEAAWSREHSLRAGRQWGVGCFSMHRRGGRHYEWMKQRGRRLDWKQPEPVCCLKRFFLCVRTRVCLCPSLHLCVIRLLAGRMISCHPQWWPSTA